ncbi:OTU domain-containing protein 6B [Biscogniauxia mediterranea]|nr:OTU domain-containing protein 6B [Biscogniauxia mediterranea]
METLEDIQSRHRKEQRDLQSRITNKKKNATKKNRKGINDECAQLERQLKERQEQELAALNGEDDTTGTKEAEKEQDQDLNGVDDTGGEDGNASAINTVTNKLKETSISSSSSSSPAVPPTSSSTQQQQQQQQTAQGGGGGQGKKRNRQKERMARRAAEQEAAAAAAEAEAANMTDHRTRERTYLEREFRARGLAEREIRPDGHCLFAAVADQLAQLGVPLLTAAAAATATKDTETDMPPYRAVRRAATDYMAAHADDFAPFLGEEEGEEQGGLEGYLRKMRDTAEWGGQLELRALASAYGVEIKVIQDGRTETIEPSEDGGGESSAAAAAAAGGEDNGDERARKTVWLAYYRHGYGLGEHYNSLMKAG